MSSRRTRGITAALGASALVGAALAGVATAANAAAASTSEASYATRQSACVGNAMRLATPLVTSRKKSGSVRERGVNIVIERIRQQSDDCVDILFRDGTAE